MTQTEMIDLAREWARTDHSAARDDVSRLGLERAANYNLGLLWQAVEDGDGRWAPLLPVGPAQVAIMMAALAEVSEESPEEDIKTLARACVRELISAARGLASRDGEIPRGDWDALTELLGRRPSEEERVTFARGWRDADEWEEL